MINNSPAFTHHDNHDSTRTTDSPLALTPVIERYTAARAAVSTLAHAPDTHRADTTSSDTSTHTDAAAGGGVGAGRHRLVSLVGLVTVSLLTLVDSIADIPGLLRELHAARLRAANLAAAGRAALAAERDGDPDPLWFLRDELADTDRRLPDPGQPCELGGGDR